MLFGGHVTHCGLPVIDGERVVLVASFSLPGGKERAHTEDANPDPDPGKTDR